MQPKTALAVTHNVQCIDYLSPMSIPSDVFLYQGTMKNDKTEEGTKTKAVIFRFYLFLGQEIGIILMKDGLKIKKYEQNANCKIVTRKLSRKP